MYNMYKNEQSGRSMVEMLGVLAIIGVLSIGGISGYSKAMAKYRVNKTLDQISMLVMNIRSLFSASVDYVGLNDKTAIQMGIIPRDMLPPGLTEANASSIMNAYQGGVFLTTGNSGGSNRSFVVQYSGLTREACVSIATADWGSQAGSGLVRISVKAGTGTKTDKVTMTDTACTANTVVNTDKITAKATYCMADMPISLAQAAGSCTSTLDTGNAIEWEYY